MKDELKRPYDNRPSLIVYMILRIDTLGTAAERSGHCGSSDPPWHWMWVLWTP